MTSKPASRSARAMTLAPRSWPSKPGLAMSTRSGGWSDMPVRPGRVGFDQLDQHAERRRRLQEGHLAVRPRPRRVVDQLDPFILQVAQVLADVGRTEAQMMQPGSATLQEPRNRTGRLRRLQQLDQHV